MRAGYTISHTNPNPDPTPYDMVSVPGGTFSREIPADDPERTDDDYDGRPQHTVTLAAFKMGKYEVTQEQWTAVMENNPSSFANNPAAGEVQANRPVEQVGWYDALVFCNKLSIKEGFTPAYSIDGKTDPAEWGAVPATRSDTVWDAVRRRLDRQPGRVSIDIQVRFIV